MARLKVRLRGKLVAEIPLSEEKSYLAGRKDDCDIRLQGDKGISREHFRLSSSGGGWTLESLSRFGVLQVGGEAVTNQVLEHGMVFAVPPYEFEFLMTSGDQSSDAASAMNMGESVGEDGQMMPVAMNHEAPPEEVFAEKTVVGVAPSVPYVKIMDAQGEAKELIRLEGGDSWLAGRESSCNIHIRDQRVSRRQFEVRKTNGNYYIIDLGSVNGTLVNGSPISSTDPTALKSGDAISVLENYLYFELHDPNFKSRLELVKMAPPVESMNHSLVAFDNVSNLMPQAPQQAPSAFAPAPWQGGAAAPALYDPSMMMPQQGMGLNPAPVPPQAAKGFDFQKNRPKVIAIVLALLAIIYFGFMNNEEAAPAPVAATDPFSKLTVEQKKLVKDTLQLAKSYYMQGKYEFAKSELVKMQQIIPEYEDSRELFKLTEEAIYVQQQQRAQEAREKEQKEQEEKIQLRAAECRKQVNPDSTRDQLEKCLGDVIALNPEHPLFKEIFNQIEKYQADKAAKMAQDADYRARVEKLHGIFGRAKALDTKNQPLSAIKAYEVVVSSSLPDPSNLRGAAKKRIAELLDMVNSRTAALQKEADHMAQEGKLRDAIYALRGAKKVDPQNPSIDEKIDGYRLKLQEDMMRIYQEGVLDESFGNVDGDENHPGAKQKWRKIIANDISDGEYYKKAYIKLKKYGSPK